MLNDTRMECKYHRRTILGSRCKVCKDLFNDTLIDSEFLLLSYPSGHNGLWSYYRQVILGLGYLSYGP